MVQSKSIKKLVASMLGDMSDADFFEMLDPCTKLTVTWKITRGQLEVIRESSHTVTKQNGMALAKDLPLVATDWKRIFSLKVFSKTPRRNEDLQLRKILLEIKKNGLVSSRRGVRFQSSINKHLAMNELAYRMVMGPSGDSGNGYDYRISKIM
jgi:hypothetical protein